jgi:hypothetical protein
MVLGFVTVTDIRLQSKKCRLIAMERIEYCVPEYAFLTELEGKHHFRPKREVVGLLDRIGR